MGTNGSETKPTADESAAASLWRDRRGFRRMEVVKRGSRLEPRSGEIFIVRRLPDYSLFTATRLYYAAHFEVAKNICVNLRSSAVRFLFVCIRAVRGPSLR
jgi:hypothetical protein